MTTFIIVTAMVALVVGSLRFASAYLDGLIDAKYPNIADGDYRNGIGRSVYALGLRHGENRIKIVSERRALTNERKEAKS